MQVSNPVFIRWKHTLTVPDVQPKNFIKLAGIKYENLSGEFIDRAGIGPFGKYEYEIE